MYYCFRWWESVRLAVWSGLTWIMEIIGFLNATHASSTPNNWFSYLWYLPGLINSLRGIGVFIILIVLPKDSRHYILELISNAWERCGGRPLKGILPPTRRSSTSTNTTATTTTTLNPVTCTDKERISLSSSDTQLSSHNTSMNELNEVSRNADVSQETISVTKSQFDDGDMKISHEKQQGKTPVVIQAIIENERPVHSQKSHDGQSPKKTKGFQPAKPPRKSLENIAVANVQEKSSGSSSANADDVESGVDNQENIEDTGNKNVDASLVESTSHCSQDSMPPMLPSSPPPAAETSSVEFTPGEIADIVEATAVDKSAKIQNKDGETSSVGYPVEAKLSSEESTLEEKRKSSLAGNDHTDLSFKSSNDLTMNLNDGQISETDIANEGSIANGGNQTDLHDENLPSSDENNGQEITERNNQESPTVSDSLSITKEHLTEDMVDGNESSISLQSSVPGASEESHNADLQRTNEMRSSDVENEKDNQKEESDMGRKTVSSAIDNDIQIPGKKFVESVEEKSDSDERLEKESMSERIERNSVPGNVQQENSAEDQNVAGGGYSDEVKLPNRTP